MQPFQQRVVEEKNELDSKVEKLQAFFSTTTLASLPLDEQDRLSKQLGLMRQYSEVLSDRIANFTGEKSIMHDS